MFSNVYKNIYNNNIIIIKNVIICSNICKLCNKICKCIININVINFNIIMILILS